MEFHRFSNDEDYTEAQVSLTRRKLEAEDPRCFVSPKLVEAIAKVVNASPHISVPVLGLCHGVREGTELQLFEEIIGGDWIGSEITPELCDGERIVQQDFSQPRPEWVGSYDIVFSNSLDHSQNPAVTLETWIDQLVPTGSLFLEWTPWHNRLGSKDNRGDCFAASLEETLALAATVGTARVAAVIPDVRQRGKRKGETYSRYLIQVAKKD